MNNSPGLPTAMTPLPFYSANNIGLPLRASAELERRKRSAVVGADFRYAPVDYIREKLGWEPWAGEAGQPGQIEVIEAYNLALKQQHEKVAFESGELDESQLIFWQPGQPIRNRIRVEAGHAVGKSKCAAGLVSHFFDSFTPAIVYTFAPTWEQIKDLLWKEIKADRAGKGLPGRVLDTCEIKLHPNHFAKGRATNSSGGKGTERIQGQHGKYLMFVLDEAEGVADFVYDAIDSMASGGISIVLMLANPRTRTSRFHKVKALSTVQSFRIACLWHPNVVQNREIIPGAVRRDYIDTMLEKHCEVVPEHDSDACTFELPWQPGVIYRPDPEFMFRVLGIAPANVGDKTVIPTGRYEAAVQRDASGDDPAIARLGVDMSRWGADYGTLYIRHAGAVERKAQFYQQDTHDYTQRVKTEILALVDLGVANVHVRVDGTGGFGGGLVDSLKADDDLRRLIPDFKVIEVNFGSSPNDPKSYADLATEMYHETAEALKELRIDAPPSQLEDDLTGRRYKWVSKGARSVKKLEDKDEFRKRYHRSPDDGDGFVLAAAPDHIFKAQTAFVSSRVATAESIFGSPAKGLRPEPTPIPTMPIPQPAAPPTRRSAINGKDIFR
jgi:hypothetical protein